MADAPVLGGEGAAAKKVKLAEAAFGARFAGALVHQSVRAEQAARRRGTAATKTRAMVSGGGAKPWRQKGTGRARAGSSRSPLWTGGGTVFGPQPRSYTFKVNRKEQRAAAAQRALPARPARLDRDPRRAAPSAKPKTARAAELLEDWEPPTGKSRPALVVLAPRGGRRRAVVSQPRARGGADARERRRQRPRRRRRADRLRAGARAAQRPHRRSPRSAAAEAS